MIIGPPQCGQKKLGGAIADSVLDSVSACGVCATVFTTCSSSRTRTRLALRVPLANSP